MRPARASERRHRTAPRRSRGTVLPLVLAMLLAGCALLYTMHRAGQVAAAKQRLVDTADAAAWSTALWRARVLNYHAYANRAILANEVAIAQAVTLVAWSKYFESLTRNATAFATVLPPAEGALAAAAEAARLARESAEVAATLEIAARGAESVGYKEILRASQDIMNLTSQGFGASMVATEVARANDRGYFAWVLPDPADTWRDFTRRGDDPADRRRFADLVVASLDPFTSGPRSEDVRTPIPSPCLNLMRLRKRGTTELSADLTRWEAVDTLSFHARTLSGLRCREREALPLGWGAAAAGPAGAGLEASGGEIGINPSARGIAEQGVTRFEAYSGITAARDLDHESLGHARYPVARLAVLVRQPGEAVSRAWASGLAAGRLAPPEGHDTFPGGHLWAMAAAEIHFRRPFDAPARVEYASLFNPYWHVRLAPPSAAQRAAAWAYVR